MNILKVGRAKQGMTQQQLADIMNVSVQTIRNWERKDTQPNAHYLVQLSLHLDITLDELVTFYAYK